MEVLLQEDIERLGKRGDVVDVADGYARNYLVPRGLAAKATQENKLALHRQRQAEEREQQQHIQELADLARKIETTSCTVAAPASPEGHLFGSIGPDQVADAFKDEGLPVEPGMISLPAHIKEIGVYTVEIRVTAEHTAVTRVWVVAE